jgi:photosystem II stability/assembly factor-like uncharacterized protein/sugar lactone lactonase YvrE
MRLNFVICALLAGLLACAWAGELPGGWESRDARVTGLLVGADFADAQVGWACGIRALIRTENGGRTWTAQRTPAKAYWFNSLVALSPTEALVCGVPYGWDGPGVLLRTSDGGQNWTPVPVGAADARLSSLTFTPSRATGYLLAGDGLWRSSDGGKSWSRVPLPSVSAFNIATRRIIALPDERTVIVGGNRALVCSADGGTTWKSHPLPAEAKNPHRQFGALSFASPTHGWAVLYGGDTLETRDGGATWTPSTAPGLPFFQTAEIGWAINSVQVARTTDGGQSWSAPTAVGGGNYNCVSMAFTAQRAFIVGGQEGTGTAFLADHQLPEVPAAPTVTGVVPITFTLPRAGYATIQILNARGEVVENLLTGKYLPAGAQTVWWDLSTLDDFWPPYSPKPHLYTPPAGLATVAPPGAYRWRGLWHPGLSLEYKFSVNPLKTAGLAWIAPDPSSGWLADHAPPETIARTGETMWIGAFAEGGFSLIETDRSMKKLWGTGRIDLACPRVLAADGDTVYFIDHGGWLGHAKQRMCMVQVERASKRSRRLWTITEGETRRPAEDLRSVDGLAVIGDRAYIADRVRQAIVVCDLAPNRGGKDATLHVLKSLPLANPGRIRPYDATHVAAVGNGGVVLIDRATDAITPVVTGLVSPHGLAVDAQGNFYVGEMAPSHQVKLFSRMGQFLRTIGKPGPHPLGPFDPERLESPADLELDAAGNLWVCERSMELKRVSVWNPAGHCVDQVIGPPVYGGGSTGIDPADENCIFNNGLEFRRDPTSGTVRLANVIWRLDDPTYEQFTQTRPHNFGGPYPAYPFRKDGKLFFSLWGGYGMGELTELWVYDKDHVRPVSAVGALPGWLKTRLGEAGKAARTFAWTDRNGDGRAQPAEVQTSSLAPGNAVWGVRMNERFEVAFSTLLGEVGLAFFRVASLTPEGYPIYALPANYQLAPHLRVNDPNQVQTVFTDRAGNAIVNSPYLFSMAPDGTINWRYKNRWPGLHAGLASSATGAEAGVLVAPLRVFGAGVVNAALGEVFCLGSNYGATDLFTTDGLYIGRAFQDSRRSTAWAFTAPPTPQQLSTVSLSQEHFGGSFQRVQGADGRDHFQYVISPGSPHATVVELHGLEAVTRLAGAPFTVTPAHVVAADRLRGQRTADLAAPKRATIPRLTGPLVDGLPAAWPGERLAPGAGTARGDGFALAYDATNLYLHYQGKDDRAPFRNAATANTYREAFTQGDVVDLLLQTQAGAPPARQDAAAGDIRLSLTTIDGVPRAILYDGVVPGTPARARHAFSSPWQTVVIDQVRVLPEVRITVERGADRFTLTAVIPLAAIHLDPRATPQVRGDVGLVVSDATGTRTVDRQYWSNTYTNIVSDIPSEARLQPNLWGTLVFE